MNHLREPFLVFLFFANMARAIRVTWTLENVQFDDVSTATVSFAYNEDSASVYFSDVSIITNMVGQCPGKDLNNVGCGFTD